VASSYTNSIWQVQQQLSTKQAKQQHCSTALRHACRPQLAPCYNPPSRTATAAASYLPCRCLAAGASGTMAVHPSCCATPGQQPHTMNAALPPGYRKQRCCTRLYAALMQLPSHRGTGGSSSSRSSCMRGRCLQQQKAAACFITSSSRCRSHSELCNSGAARCGLRAVCRFSGQLQCTGKSNIPAPSAGLPHMHMRAWGTCPTPALRVWQPCQQSKHQACRGPTAVVPHPSLCKCSACRNERHCSTAHADTHHMHTHSPGISHTCVAAE
jgi:hypothetical protein